MTNQVKEDSVPSLRVVDIIFAIICIAFSIFLMIGSVRLGAKWTPEGPESGYFPFYIFLMMLIASSVTLYEAIVINKKKPGEDFVEKHAFQQILCILFPAIAFLIGVSLIGIYVSSTVYIAIFMIWIGKYSYWKATLVGLSVGVILYLMFEVWFQVPLPHGSWFNPLSYIGVN